jgi:hypothetical protein
MSIHRAAQAHVSIDRRRWRISSGYWNGSEGRNKKRCVGVSADFGVLDSGKNTSLPGSGLRIVDFEYDI